ncbi:MAG: hypothetical protein KBB29_07855, partial [Bacteroidales bacterium]|nr:hypothetical protein [Bacteroidales bacterium]
LIFAVYLKTKVSHRLLVLELGLGLVLGLGVRNRGGAMSPSFAFIKMYAIGVNGIKFKMP